MSKKHEFSPVSKQVQYDRILQDTPTEFHKNLTWESVEKIHVQPIYTREDISSSSSISNSYPKKWDAGQIIALTSDKSLFMSQINQAISQEVSFLLLSLSPDFSSWEELIELLDGFQGKVWFDSSIEQVPLIPLSFYQKEYYFLTDIYRQFARNGKWYKSEIEDESQWLNIYQKAAAPIVFLDGSIYQNAGATHIEQISFCLLQLQEYLNLIPTDANNKKPKCIIRYSVGSNYFFEIAKGIALRQLVESLLTNNNYSVDIELLAEPSKRNKTATSYNVNLLRTTTEMMSAILGGADIICNHPYDLNFQESTPFSDRIARNQLFLLQQESAFSELPNPAQGSYYIEGLVAEISEKAWELFKSIELDGGWTSAFKSGKIQKMIAVSANAERLEFDQGSKVLVGTTKYQDKDSLSATALAKPILDKGDYPTINETPLAT